MSNSPKCENNVPENHDLVGEQRNGSLTADEQIYKQQPLENERELIGGMC